jgi:Ca-activated chloride channel family protein
MFDRVWSRISIFLSLILLATSGLAQVMSIPSSGFGNIGSHDAGTMGGSVGLDLISSEQMTNNLFGMTTNMHAHDQYQLPDASLSSLDLQASARARREFDAGYRLVLKKDFQNALPHLTKATEIYPQFVAAHNAIGTAYLGLGKNEQARDEFIQAITLDGHLPNLHLNLGIAELALKDYPAAESSLQKASAIAPLDMSLLRALAYSEFANKDYPAVIATANEVHARQHEDSAIVHYFAAGAFEAQNNFTDAQHELETLLREDPKFAGAEQARQFLQELKADQAMQASLKHQQAPPVTFAFEAGKQPTAEEATRQVQQIMQDVKEKSQIAEAEAAEAQAANSATDTKLEAKVEAGPTTSNTSRSVGPGGTLRSSVDEVSVFFAATDHGKSVTDLKGNDIGVRDDEKSPAAILGFRNEAQLPLRLGLIIDTSASITSRFHFEQSAAINFVQHVVTGKDDLGFVVGVNNSVLMVQDFTADQARLSQAVNELAPSGGTALWDAVTFAANKLVSRVETQPVSRILVVVSDGQDNSSVTALKQAIAHAQHGEVAVYTVSTRDFDNDSSSASLGEHALRTLSELTGGAAFTPGSINRLKSSLTEMQQVIRGRYLISYKPALFQRNGQYRTIDISAKKDGHKLRIYARKGYYATVNTPVESASSRTTTELKAKAE